MVVAALHRHVVETVVDLLQRSRRLLFITGAGISADSGLPTYRGVGGLYNGGGTVDGVAIEEALSGAMLAERPDITWKHLIEIAHAAQGKTCNRGHEVIAAMERRFERVWTLTQNIDGFHRQAGAENVIEIHGDLRDLYCPRCKFAERRETFDGLAVPPRCPACGAVVRPDVVLFGEFIPNAKLALLQRALDDGFDMVFSIGTTSVFPYIRLPVQMARRLGRPSVEINPGTTHVSHLVDYRLPLGAAEALDAIWCEYLRRTGGGDCA